MRIPVLVIRHLHIDSAPGVVAVLAEINMIVIQKTRTIYSHVPRVNHRVVVTLYERSDCDINPGGLYRVFLMLSGYTLASSSRMWRQLGFHIHKGIFLFNSSSPGPMALISQTTFSSTFS